MIIRYEDALRGREQDKEKIDQLLVTLSEVEAEVLLLRRRIENLEEEVARLKKENHRLVSELQRARTVRYLFFISSQLIVDFIYCMNLHRCFIHLRQIILVIQTIFKKLLSTQ